MSVPDALLPDREEVAAQVLDVAVREAITKIRQARHTSPEWRVVRADQILLPAAQSANRILGDTPRAAA